MRYLCILLLVWLGISVSEAQTPTKRFALVIGNANYAFNKLRNPINDANAVASSLTKCGFEVIKVSDADIVTMEKALNEFATKSRQYADATRLFYFAGHGVQINGENYLLPINNSGLNDEADFKHKSMPFEYIRNKINTGSGLTLYILDACRNNPLSEAPGRSTDRGLKPVAPKQGEIIMYATAANAIAEDGTGKNGVFTEELIKYLTEPGLEVQSIFRKTGDAVSKRTGGKQMPNLNISFYEEYYFTAPAQPKVTIQEKIINFNDRDDDGLANTIDRCPDEKGPARNDGCPEAKTDTTTTNIIPPSPKPEVRKDLPNLPEVVFVRGGTFSMGDTFGEGVSDEKPTHEVTVSDFYMGKYEVTFEEYDLFCEATGREKPSDEGWGRGKRPVIDVSWDDATAYCEWASRTSGKKYRLPTEAEWEYAAREGGKKVRLGNGKNTLDPKEANFDGSAGYKEAYSVAGEYRVKTLPVGSFAGNSLGLYDMTGNVWEWCRDWYAADYYGKSPSRDPENTTATSNRVLRGGSWSSHPAYCRAANRSYNTPSNRFSSYGFRVVLAP